MRSMTALDIGHYSFLVHTTEPAPKFPETAGFSPEIPGEGDYPITGAGKSPESSKLKSPSWKGRASKKN